MRRAMQALLDTRFAKNHRLNDLVGACIVGDTAQRTHIQLVFPCKERRWAELVAFSIFVYRPDREEGEVTLICTRVGMEGLGIAGRLVKMSLRVANKAKLLRMYVRAGTEAVPFWENSGRWMGAVQEPGRGFPCACACQYGELFRQDLRTQRKPIRKRDRKTLNRRHSSRH